MNGLDHNGCMHYPLQIGRGPPSPALRLCLPHPGPAVPARRQRGSAKGRLRVGSVRIMSLVRKFTKRLSKPGMAAELQQSVSEAMCSSFVLVSVGSAREGPRPGPARRWVAAGGARQRWEGAEIGRGCAKSGERKRKGVERTWRKDRAGSGLGRAGDAQGMAGQDLGSARQGMRRAWLGKAGDGGSLFGIPSMCVVSCHPAGHPTCRRRAPVSAQSREDCREAALRLRVH